MSIEIKCTKCGTKKTENGNESSQKIHKAALKMSYIMTADRYNLPLDMERFEREMEKETL